MSQQTSDQLSRYRWAGFLVATAAGLYVSRRLYHSYTQLPATTLRRSNAVHRNRNNGLGPVDFEPPTSEAPFGFVLIRKHNNETMAINLATTRLPSAQVLRELFGNGSEAIRRNAQTLALQCVLALAWVKAQDAEGRLVLRSHGFDELATAMLSQQMDAILQASYALLTSMDLDTVDPQYVREAVESLNRDNPWHSGNASSSGDEDPDPADTEEVWDAERAEPSQGLRGLLYYIAEDDAKRKAYEHRGIRCEECGDLPIHGVRWHCLNCPDFDLCSACEAHTRHPKTHVFAKIKIPVPVLSQPTEKMKPWYPGDSRKIHASLFIQLKKQLCLEYDYEEPQLDAMYDQFTCLANVPWEQDPTKIKCAIDRRAFNRAMTSDRWPAGLATNAMYDRMFAFYDTDTNGLIGFTEFVNGMAYLRGPKRFASLRRTIQGYDLDGDGYVSRADFLRILRAKHIIQTQLISDQVEFQEDERVQASMDVLRSSQPISSIFAEEQIPPGERRHPRGKYPDEFGDLQPLPTTKAVLSDEDPYVRRLPARDRLRTTLSRFEEHIGRSTRQGEDSSRDEDVEEQVALSMLAPVEEETIDPYVQDILWQVEESGFNELLDPLFKDREEEDTDVMRTRVERRLWASDIEDALAAREAGLLPEPGAAAAAAAVKQSTPTSKPSGLASTAVEVPQRTDEIIAELANAIDGIRSGSQGPTTAADSIVPTDWLSLERREAQIAEAPLEDLLNSQGYGLRDNAHEGAAASEPRVASSDSSSIWNGIPADRATSPLKTTTISDNDDHNHDNSMEPPPLPQRQTPPSPPPPQQEKKTTASEPSRLSQLRLEQLVRLHDLDAEITRRGGPGRLTYDEIENLVVKSGNSELRGLVKSWLEWACF